MAPKFQTLFRNWKMALRRCRNVNDIRPGRLQHFRKIGEACSYPGPLPELFGHQQLAVADSDNFTTWNAMDGLDMLIGDLAAADKRHPKGARS